MAKYLENTWIESISFAPAQPHRTRDRNAVRMQPIRSGNTRPIGGSFTSFWIVRPGRRPYCPASIPKEKKEKDHRPCSERLSESCDPRSRPWIDRRPLWTPTPACWTAGQFDASATTRGLRPPKPSQHRRPLIGPIGGAREIRVAKDRLFFCPERGLGPS